MNNETETPVKRWRVASTGNHQGLVIDEDTGRNIAVSYEKEDAPLLAAAPDLLEACQKLVAWLRAMREVNENLVIESGPDDGFNLTEAEAVIFPLITAH